MGSVKYQLEGSRLTIETGITPSGQVTRVATSDYSSQFVDEKKNLIRIEIYGLQKVARMEKAFNFGEWGEAEKPKVDAKRAEKIRKVAAKVVEAKSKREQKK